ncbi:MAG: hypothetical protein ACPF9D_12795 [Owenweeksia sp.]
MRRFLKLSAIALLLSAWVVSCAPDNDDDINFIAEYTGTWDCRENTGINAPQVYKVNIQRGASDQEIIINNLYNLSSTAVKANINGFSLSIPSQTSAGVSFSGSGSAGAEFQEISLSFTANDGSGNDQVSAILTR